MHWLGNRKTTSSQLVEESLSRNSLALWQSISSPQDTGRVSTTTPNVQKNVDCFALSVRGSDSDLVALAT
jgi:beta-lactam-binding protein with PASTA domain